LIILIPNNAGFNSCLFYIIVFRSEQTSENPISALSWELSDTSVYSFLEEMKQIAEKVRRRP